MPLEVSLLSQGRAEAHAARTIRLHSAPQQRLPQSPGARYELTYTFHLSHVCCRVRTDQLPFERDARRSSRRTWTDANQAAQMALVMPLTRSSVGSLGGRALRHQIQARPLAARSYAADILVVISSASGARAAPDSPSGAKACDASAHSARGSGCRHVRPSELSRGPPPC